MFRIGDFSKFSRVSVRMLRHYDQLGLLRPARVDPETDYRYYSADQLTRLHRILALQDIGFSLDQIGDLLDRKVSAEEMRGMLKLKRAELENRVQSDVERLARIEERIARVEASDLNYEVILRKVQAVKVATIKGREDEDLTPLFEDLERYVGTFGVRGEQPPLALFSNTSNGEIESLAAVPIKEKLPETDQIKMLDLPEILKMACVVHHGSYSEMEVVGDALMRWIESNAYRVSGPLREVYYRFGADQQGYELPVAYLTNNDDEFVTELQVPVERN